MVENFRKFSESAPTLTIVPMKRGVGVVTTKSGCGPFALLGERIRTSYCVKIYYFVASGPLLPPQKHQNVHVSIVFGHDL